MKPDRQGIPFLLRQILLRNPGTMVRDAVSFDDDERPRIIRLHLVREELIAV